MSVGRICTRIVATASARETVRDAADRMAENNVGTLVVIDDADRPLGIVTDRDLVTRVLASRLDPDATLLDDVMTEPVRKVEESTPIEQALETMKGAGVRRVVVVGEESRLMGLLSLDDVLELLVEEAESIGEILRAEQPATRATA